MGHSRLLFDLCLAFSNVNKLLQQKCEKIRLVSGGGGIQTHNL